MSCYPGLVPSGSVAPAMDLASASWRAVTSAPCRLAWRRSALERLALFKLAPLLELRRLRPAVKIYVSDTMRIEVKLASTVPEYY